MQGESSTLKGMGPKNKEIKKMGKLDAFIRVCEKVVLPAFGLGIIGAGAYGLYRLGDKAIDKGYKIGAGCSYNLDTKTVSANMALDLLKEHENTLVEREASLEQSANNQTKISSGKNKITKLS